jgi:hypothetical protein
LNPTSSQLGGAMSELLTIGEVAEQAHVATSTIR